MGSGGRFVRPRTRLLSLALVLGLVGALIVALAPPANAASIVVDTLDDADTDNSQCSLREAILNANANDQSGSTDCTGGTGDDVITFSASILPGTIYLDAQLPGITAAGGDVTIDGPGAASLTISGDTNDDGTTTTNVRILKVLLGASLDLSGVTIAEGLELLNDGGGGGLRNEGGTVAITDSVFSENEAAFSPEGGGMYIDLGTVSITNSTFSGNTASSSGGGIYNDGGMLTVTGSTFSDNGAVVGGGLLNLFGTVTVTGSTFSLNMAQDAGGAYTAGGTLDVTGSTFSDNETTFSSGALFDHGSMVDVTDSIFSGNTASEGGAIKIDDGGTLHVMGSTFSGNTAFSGGAIHNGGTLTVTNSTLSGNCAGIACDGGTGAGEGIADVTLFNGTDGGGLYNELGTATFTFATIAGNSATFGGGIFRIDGTVILRATIVANSPAGGDCSGNVTDAGYNLSSDGTCGFSGTSVNNTDPMLGPLSNNGGPTRTMALTNSSPAAGVIPVGQPAGAECATTIDTDQRGEPRPGTEDDAGNLCEIGAYEIQEPEQAPSPAPGPGLPTPSVISMSPGSGPVGTTVTFTGTNLSNASVRFNGTPAPVGSTTPTQVVATVPAGATTGPVRLTTSFGSAFAGTFIVTPDPPVIASFSPAKGKVGTSVVISGSNFTGTTVSFGGTFAAFVADSPSQITATVPPGAGTGPIQVGTDGGIATSASSFVVRHGRRVSLGFIGKLRGSVSVSDAWSACADRVPVRLQHREGGAFTTVASKRTTASGAYRFGGIDEPGRYRVLARRLTLASGDVCGGATSSVLRR